MISGVHQGSYLGHLLFSMFINDIKHILQNSNFLLFADVLKIYLEISSNEDKLKLQNDLNGFRIWSKNNGLVLNDVKCLQITFWKEILIVLITLLII